MDKKNTTIGVILLVLAFATFFYTSTHAPKPAPVVQTSITTTVPLTTAATTTADGHTSFATTSAASADSPSFAALSGSNAHATITTLNNDYVEVRLTDFGGAIDNVAFKKYSAVPGTDAPFIFNQPHATPILAFDQAPGVDQDTRYELVSATPTNVVYRTIRDKSVEVTRSYTLHAPGDSTGDPYSISESTTFRNLTDAPAPLPNILNLGTSALTTSQDNPLYLNVASYDGKENPRVIETGEFTGGGLLSSIGLSHNAPKSIIEGGGPIVWATVKNQFFASIYTPDKPGAGIIVRPVQLPAFTNSSRPDIGLTGDIRLDLPALPPHGTVTTSGQLYVGPKEYARLSKFTNHQDKVMQYDRSFYNRIVFSGVIAPAMNLLMNWMHSFVGNWGVAIILMTILLKIVSLPFTLAASRSAKRMQKLQPLMKAVREKHKDQPQKLNQATMELFKEHKVNPMGGCLPVLITIPLFIGFYSMLLSTAELRFQSFLWARDLSSPDTVGHIFGLPINIMPILMGVTMVIQMRLTPQPSIDSAQQKIFKFMPVFFSLICYNFPCALALYSTINGLFTIGQQLVVNKYTVDPVPAPLGVPSGTGKKIKNVTPPKKK